ncbi:hypothetical protein HDU86_004464 [Geranomyces michiganensis]|nr:hypothetical protein HDU86_004464 [Geranomyces michiganensis]
MDEFTFQDVVKVDWASDRADSPVMKDEVMEFSTIVARSEIVDEQSATHKSFALDGQTSAEPAELAPAAETSQPQTIEAFSNDLYASVYSPAAIEDENGDSALEESGLGPERESDTEEAGSWENSRIEEAIALARVAVSAASPTINQDGTPRMANESSIKRDDEKVIYLCGVYDLYKKVAPVLSNHFDLRTPSSHRFDVTPDLAIYVTDFSSLFHAITNGSLFDHAAVANAGKFLVLTEEHEADSVRRLLAMSEVDYISGGKHGVWTIEETFQWRPRDINRLLNRQRAEVSTKNRCFLVTVLVAFFTAAVIGTLAGISMCGGGMPASLSILSSFFERSEIRGTGRVVTNVASSAPDVLIQSTFAHVPAATMTSTALRSASMTPLPDTSLNLEEEEGE